MEPSPLSVDELVRKTDSGWRPGFAFFWSHEPARPGVLGNECFSQWYPAPFVVDGVGYPTAEHFMMAAKARLFGDHATAAAILAARAPGHAKQLGRGVAGFDEDTWVRARVEIVVCASKAKFTQNPALLAYLLATNVRVLAEASPTDRVWGIGLEAGDERAKEPRSWRGLNLLGFALMRARDDLAAGAP